MNKLFYIIPIVLILTLFLILNSYPKEVKPGISVMLFDKSKNPIQKTFAIVNGMPYVGFIQLKVSVKNTNVEPLTCFIQDLVTTGGNGNPDIFSNSMSDNTDRVLPNKNSVGAWITDLINVDDIANKTSYTFIANVNCTSNIGNGPISIGILSYSMTLSINNDPFCGNGIKELGELCDGLDLGGIKCYNVESNFNGGILNCNSNCQSWNTSLCTSPTTQVCGDGVISGTEVCELGNDGIAGNIDDDINGHTCDSEGYTGGNLFCSSDCLTFDEDSCTNYVCGNNLIEGTELCDGTDLGNPPHTCQDEGFDDGELYCLDNSQCNSWNTSSCYDTYTCSELSGIGCNEGQTCDGGTFQNSTDYGLLCCVGGTCTTPPSKKVIWRTPIPDCSWGSWSNSNDKWVAFDADNDPSTPLKPFGYTSTSTTTSHNTDDFPWFTSLGGTSPCGLSIDCYGTASKSNGPCDVIYAINVDGSHDAKFDEDQIYTNNLGVDPCCGTTCGTCCERYDDGTSNC